MKNLSLEGFINLLFFKSFGLASKKSLGRTDAFLLLIHDLQLLLTRKPNRGLFYFALAVFSYILKLMGVAELGFDLFKDFLTNRQQREQVQLSFWSEYYF